VETNKTVLFVYGTLKRGHSGHHFLAGQEFLGEAVTLPLYRLYGFGWHPGLVLDEANGVEVAGELWAVDDVALARLDAYEGTADGWFLRADVAVRDCFETVQTYFYNHLVPPDAPTGAAWPFPV
jgi:gamma-glutamylaminecyclotransferase